MTATLIRSLKSYRERRNFHKTPEPSGQKPIKTREPIFVIQKHEASHLHYDFRLEAEGVLKSWAVPKGPSTDPQVKRLAIETEDHPLDYANFEGTIPKGQYGGGDVMIWDRGTYQNVTRHEGHEISAGEAIQRGHIVFVLNGKKLHGSFALTRTGFRGNKPQWLLVKMQDRSESASRTPVAATQVKAAEFPDWISPMLATLVDHPFDRPGWIYEPKLDGERCIAYRQGDKIHLFSRNRQPLDITYPEIVQAIKKQRGTSFVLDGEIVAFEPGTERTSFKLLQQRMHLRNARDVQRNSVSVVYCLFDLLYFDGRDVRPRPLRERKTMLERALQFSEKLRLNPFTEKNATDYYRHACRQQWEGIIAKRADSPYSAGRSQDWVKFKCTGEQEFIVGGYTDPQGSRAKFGALLIGYYEGDALKFAGKVGTGFDAQTLSLFSKKLAALERKTSPFDSVDLPRRGLHWVDPKLIVEIGFANWTDEGKLRQPRYLGLRDDKRPEEVTREKATQSSAVARNPSQIRLGNKVLKVSNLNKVFYPSTGFTKGQMLDFYIKAAPVLLPHLKGRPMTLKRYPDGVEGTYFYEKQAPSYRPDWLHTYAMRDDKSGKTVEYCVVNDIASLLWIVNLATLELHTFLARATDVNTPTLIAFDLDPGPSCDLLDCIRVAFSLRKILDSVGLKSFPKTSGGKGLHVYIPLNTPVTYASTQDFAHGVALLLERQDPKRIVSNMRKELRQGKVFVDWSQNTRHKTTVSVYSLRAQSTPSVSTPMTWSELQNALVKRDVSKLRFTPEQVLKRIDQKGDLFAPVQTLRQKLPRWDIGGRHDKNT